MYKTLSTLKDCINVYVYISFIVVVLTTLNIDVYLKIKKVQSILSISFKNCNICIVGGTCLNPNV